METKVLEAKKNRLVLKMKGVDHTLLNSVRKELWNDGNVTAAGYHIKHPQISTPELIVETNGKEDPKKAVVEAIKRLQKQNKQLMDVAKKQIK